MSSIRRPRAVAVLAIALAGLLAACGTNSSEGGSSAAGGGTNVLTSSMPVTSNYDPDVLFELQPLEITNAMYEGLVRYVPGGSEIEGVLAESWTISPDGLTFTFALDPDATFSDGSPVDSAAVQAAFERKAEIGSTPAYILWPVSGYETPDAQTFVITLSQPVNNFLYMLASPAGSVITNVAAIEANASDGDDLGEEYLQTNSAGSGPYTLSEFVPDERVVLARNDDYWGEAPQFDQIVFKVLPDTSSQRLQVEQGDIDLMQGVSPEAAAELEDSSAVTVESIAGFNLAFYQMNVTKAPFDDAAVRQALVRSIPFDEMVEAVWGKWATRSKQMLPADRLPTDMAVFDPPYEPDAFAEATADLPKSEPVTLGLIAPDEGNVAARVNDYVAEVLRDAGYEVEITPVTSPEYFGMVNAPELAPNMIFSIQPDDGAHPDNWFSLFLKSGAALNVGGIGIPEADALMDEANAVPAGQPIDEALYGRAGDILSEQVHFVPIADVPTRFVHSNDLSNLQMHFVVPPAVWLQNITKG